MPVITTSVYLPDDLVTFHSHTEEKLLAVLTLIIEHTAEHHTCIFNAMGPIMAQLASVFPMYQTTSPRVATTICSTFTTLITIYGRTITADQVLPLTLALLGALPSPLPLSQGLDRAVLLAAKLSFRIYGRDMMAYHTPRAQQIISWTRDRLADLLAGVLSEGQIALTFMVLDCLGRNGTAAMEMCSGVIEDVASVLSLLGDTLIPADRNIALALIARVTPRPEPNIEEAEPLIPPLIRVHNSPDTHHGEATRTSRLEWYLPLPICKQGAERQRSQKSSQSKRFARFSPVYAQKWMPTSVEHTRSTYLRFRRRQKSARSALVISQPSVHSSHERGPISKKCMAAGQRTGALWRLSHDARKQRQGSGSRPSRRRFAL